MANFPRLDELAVAANSRGLFNGMLVYFDRENGKDLDFANGLHNLWAELLERTNESLISEIVCLKGGEFEDSSGYLQRAVYCMGPMFTTSLFLGAHKAPAVKLVDNERTKQQLDAIADAAYRRGNKRPRESSRVYGIPYLDKEGLKNLETHLLTFTIFGLLVLISFSTKKKLSTQTDPEFTFQFLEEFELCDSYVVCEANREDTCHNLSQQPKSVDTQGQMYRNSVGQKRKRPGVQTRCGKRRSIDQRLPGHTTVTEAVRSSSARAEVIGDFSGPVQIAMQNYGTVST
ncbi:hypothetical protein Tco_0531229 [Tanacetum coccineum]